MGIFEGSPGSGLIPLATAIVSAIFAAAVAIRYARSRRVALLFWTVGLAMFSLAALAGAYDRAELGTREANYRVFYLFGAICNVAWLALGTVAIAAPRFTRVAFVLVLALTLAAIYPVFALPVDPRAAHDNGRGFADGSLPRILAAIGSGVGSLVLLGGAVWSAWVFMRRRHNGRRAVSNIVIAVGVLIAALGGTVTFTGASGILEFTNLIGVSVMFAGFLLA